MSKEALNNKEGIQETRESARVFGRGKNILKEPT